MSMQPVNYMIAQAIREGRHSHTFRTVCEVCREWTEAVMHVALDGKRMCRKCAEAAGVKFDQTRR
jgi:formylmethanofuran dehydrogenase subunit E